MIIFLHKRLLGASPAGRRNSGLGLFETQMDSATFSYKVFKSPRAPFLARLESKVKLPFFFKLHFLGDEKHTTAPTAISSYVEENDKRHFLVLHGLTHLKNIDTSLNYSFIIPSF